MTSWSEGPPAPPRVRRLRRIRVLLLSRDRRLLRVTAFLLRREGFAVDTTPRPFEALPLIERLQPDVAVIDGNGSLSEAVRRLAEIEALFPRVAVLIVSEHAEDGRIRNFRLLPKWAAADRLADEIKRAYLRLGPSNELAADLD